MFDTKIAAIPDMLERLAETLHGLEIPATMHPDQIPVPGAFVMLDTLDVTRFRYGEAEGTVAVTLVARDTGTQSAMRVLCQNLDKVSQALPPPARCDITTLQTGGAILPALKLTYEF